jgi:hypothetical protein
MGAASIRKISFTHCQNNDATIDSICGSCFLVVARVSEEADLECLERRHECQPFERRRSIRTVHRLFAYQSSADIQLFRGSGYKQSDMSALANKRGHLRYAARSAILPARELTVPDGFPGV